MRYLFLSVLAAGALSLGSCSQETSKEVDTDLITNPATASGDVDTENAPAFTWESETHDFGTITQGEKTSFSYKFTNTGKSDLIISSARGSCGCTVPDYPKNPIKPGESGKIDVVFDSEGKSGRTQKSVTIVANTYPATTVLQVTGEIVAPEANLQPNE